MKFYRFKDLDGGESGLICSSCCPTPLPVNVVEALELDPIEICALCEKQVRELKN